MTPPACFLLFVDVSCQLGTNFDWVLNPLFSRKAGAYDSGPITGSQHMRLGLPAMYHLRTRHLPIRGRKAEWLAEEVELRGVRK
ncbi:MAG: hypothetical protein EBZ23_10385 [Rhodobacteraceae bacterium]|nr:hypothetical protein [Paracoccaceae bacterium]